jgi:ankyrin repeat protein
MFGCTLLFYAAWNNNIEVAEQLIEMGININHQDDAESTPTSFCSRK